MLTFARVIGKNSNYDNVCKGMSQAGETRVGAAHVSSRRTTQDTFSLLRRGTKRNHK